jgi:hypothetical protein
MPLAVLPWVTYLALPISVHPLVILLPSAALLGLAVSLTAGQLQKVPLSHQSGHPQVPIVCGLKQP